MADPTSFPGADGSAAPAGVPPTGGADFAAMFVPLTSVIGPLAVGLQKISDSAVATSTALDALGKKLESTLQVAAGGSEKGADSGAGREGALRSLIELGGLLRESAGMLHELDTSKEVVELLRQIEGTLHAAYELETRRGGAPGLHGADLPEEHAKLASLPAAGHRAKHDASRPTGTLVLAKAHGPTSSTETVQQAARGEAAALAADGAAEGAMIGAFAEVGAALPLIAAFAVAIDGATGALKAFAGTVVSKTEERTLVLRQLGSFRSLSGAEDSLKIVDALRQRDPDRSAQVIPSFTELLSSGRTKENAARDIESLQDITSVSGSDQINVGEFVSTLVAARKSGEYDDLIAGLMKATDGNFSKTLSSVLSATKDPRTSKDDRAQLVDQLLEDLRAVIGPRHLSGNTPHGQIANLEDSISEVFAHVNMRPLMAVLESLNRALDKAAPAVKELEDAFNMLFNAAILPLTGSGFDLTIVLYAIAGVFRVLAIAAFPLTMALRGLVALLSGVFAIVDGLMNGLIAAYHFFVPAAAPDTTATAATGVGAAAHAMGGITTRPHLAWVGEREPEVILPLSQAPDVLRRTLDTRKTGGLSMGDVHIDMPLTVHGEGLSKEELRLELSRIVPLSLQSAFERMAAQVAG